MPPHSCSVWLADKLMNESSRTWSFEGRWENIITKLKIFRDRTSKFLSFFFFILFLVCFAVSIFSYGGTEGVREIRKAFTEAFLAFPSTAALMLTVYVVISSLNCLSVHLSVTFYKNSFFRGGQIRTSTDFWRLFLPPTGKQGKCNSWQTS